MTSINLRDYSSSYYAVRSFQLRTCDFRLLAGVRETLPSIYLNRGLTENTDVGNVLTDD